LVYGGGAEGLPNSFFYPFFNGKPYPGLLADSKEGDYIDDVLTTRAIKFLRNNKDSSFFLSLNFYAPHVPIQGKPELVKKYAAKRAAGNYNALPNDEYAAMVESIDANVGRVVAAVKELKLDNNTLIIFTSDNGGLSVQEVPAFAKHTPPTVSNPMRDGKGYITQGGIKTPWIIWGNSIKNKGSVNSSLISTDDIFNTVMEVTGTNAKSPDGKSFVGVLNGTDMTKAFNLHFPHYSPQRGKPGAVRIDGDYKLVEWYEDGKLELYNIKTDEGEAYDLAKEQPSRVAQMKAELDKWRTSLNAKMCTPNPIYSGQ
jgi:arylsulfatase A